MPRIHEMVDSKFIKKEDVGDGKLATIRNIKKYNVGTDQNPEEKWCLEFDEFKPLVLNVSNMNRLEVVFKSDNSDDWIGKQIVLFNDMSVEYKGEIVGGVRVDVNRTVRYHAKNNPSKAEPPKPVPTGSPGQRFDDMTDDIPFR